MAFADLDQPGDDLYVRSILPHRVIKKKATASGKDGVTEYKEVASKFFSRLLASKNATVFHGGANAVLMEGNQTTGEEPYFLASFHSISGSQYRTYMYKFEALPPYSIIKISGKLPLLGAPIVDTSVSSPMAFNSGLTVLPSKDVLLSYGSSNVESRFLFMPQGQYDRFFEKDA